MGCTSSSTAAAGAVENKLKLTLTTDKTTTTAPRPPIRTTTTSTEHSFFSSNGTVIGAAASVDIKKKDHAAAVTPSPTPSYSSSSTNNNPCLHVNMQEAFKKEFLLAPAVSGTVSCGGDVNTSSEDDAKAGAKASACEWTIRYSCLTVKGRDPDDASKPNQDAFGVTEDFLKNQENTNDNTTKYAATSLFFGVYDGHGAFGKESSQFVQQRLPRLIQEQIIIQKEKDYSQQQQQQQQQQHSQAQLHDSLHKAHIACNEELHANETINDAYSGSTSISLLMDISGNNSQYGNTNCRITVCNVGDSRAILGTTRNNTSPTRADDHDIDENENHAATTKTSLQTISLSIDQTPKRSDEAARCKMAGARILSFGELNPSNDNNESDDDDDDVEDPPRVWAPNGNYPGTAFSRSLGDAVAETLGVHAQPEISTLHLSHHEKCIVLATDGVFDVLTNQQVMNLCYAHYNDNNNNDSASSSASSAAAATRACQDVLEASYNEWLRNEECSGDDDAYVSYDDMTIICIFIDHVAHQKDSHRHDNDNDDFINSIMKQVPASLFAIDENIGQQQQLVVPPPNDDVHHQSKRRRQKTLHLFSLDDHDDNDDNNNNNNNEAQ